MSKAARKPKQTWSGLDELLGILRRHGVTRMSCGDISVELGPAPRRQAPVAAGDELVDDEGLCRCGHHLQHAHSDGGCLEGCDLSWCVPLTDSTPSTTEVP